MRVCMLGGETDGGEGVCLPGFLLQAVEAKQQEEEEVVVGGAEGGRSHRRKRDTSIQKEQQLNISMFSLLYYNTTVLSCVSLLCRKNQ